MNITRTLDGVLFNCHRVSCGLKPGFIGSGAASLHEASKTGWEAKPYTGETLPLTELDIDFFSKKYEIATYNYIRATEQDEYLLPIVDQNDFVRGYNQRQPWKDAPRKGVTGRPKSKVWMHCDLPVQATYYGDTTAHTVLLVEDQLSAIKAAQHANVSHAVALMGSHLDIPRVREIAMLRPYEVLLALDTDATAQAFELAREFGLAFPKMRVVILDRDIKDTPAAEINKVLGL